MTIIIPAFSLFIFYLFIALDCKNPGLKKIKSLNIFILRGVYMAHWLKCLKKLSISGSFAMKRIEVGAEMPFTQIELYLCRQMECLSLKKHASRLSPVTSENLLRRVARKSSPSLFYLICLFFHRKFLFNFSNYNIILKNNIVILFSCC